MRGVLLGWCGLGVLVCLAAPAAAGDFYVDPLRGDDRADGLAAAAAGGHGPVRTLARGVALVGPGDTLHLAPLDRPYRESLVLHNRRGEPGRPLVIDGHGATLDGSEPLRPEDWEPAGPDLIRGRPPIDLNDAVVARYFFLIDGRMERMGRSLKGPKAEWLRPAALAPGQWTYLADEQQFYLRLPRGAAVGDGRVAAPIRSSGVAMSGDCRHVVVRNLRLVHVYNDGLNIHGVSRDVLFERCAALECGDDGASAHGDCQITIRGFVSAGNSTGMCHTNDSQTDCEGVLIRDCHGFDYFVLDSGRHRLANSLILSRAAQAVHTTGRAGPGAPPCRVEFVNVALRRLGDNPFVRLYAGSEVEWRNVSCDGFDLVVTAERVAVVDSLLGGGDGRRSVTVRDAAVWSGSGNRYHLASLRLGDETLTAETLAPFQQATGREAGSRWGPFEFAVPFTGQPVDAPAAGAAGAGARLPGADVSALAVPEPPAQQ